MAGYRELFDASIEDPCAFWADAARAVTWIREPLRILDDSNPPFYRWFPDGRAQHLRQRAGPARRRRTWRPGRADLRLPRHRHQAHLHLRRAPRRDVPVRRRAARPRRRQGRPRGDLHADGARGGHRDAGLRTVGRRALGGVRRLRRARARGAHRRRAPRGRRLGVMRHRADPHRRLQADARRGAGHRRAHHPALRHRAARAASLRAGARPRRRLGRGASPRRSPSTPSRSPRPIRSTCCTPRAPPASPRASSATTAGTPSRCCGRCATSTTRSRAKCSGPLRMSAGWWGTPTSSTGRCCSARRPCSTRASRSARPMRARSGGWPPSTA